jgi:hypothetical protein
LADHPTIQVERGPVDASGKKYTIGPLGLINGFFGVHKNSYGAICAVYEERCPNGCRDKYDGDLPEQWKNVSVGDTCPECGATALTIGKLIRFQRTSFGVTDGEGKK